MIEGSIIASRLSRAFLTELREESTLVSIRLLIGVELSDTASNSGVVAASKTGLSKTEAGLRGGGSFGPLEGTGFECRASKVTTGSAGLDAGPVGSAGREECQEG